MSDLLTRGFVFAATGEDYRSLTIKAVASVRRHHPAVPIDVYFDEDVPVPEADRVLPLPGDARGARPKFHALRHNRFSRAIYLDADLICVAPIDDVFDLIERYDFAFSQIDWRNCFQGQILWRKPIPNVFPQVNGGVIAMNRSGRTERFIDDWEAGYLAHGCGKDQPALRELLWDDADIRFAVLPDEYNFFDFRMLDRRTPNYPAPRIIHNNMIHTPRIVAAPHEQVLPLLMGHARVSRLQTLLTHDKTLRGNAPYGSADRPVSLGRRLHHAVSAVRDLPRKAKTALRSLGNRR